MKLRQICREPAWEGASCGLGYEYLRQEKEVSDHGCPLATWQTANASTRYSEVPQLLRIGMEGWASGFHSPPLAVRAPAIIEPF